MQHAELEGLIERNCSSLNCTTGKAEQVYEVLSEEAKATFDKAVSSLKQRLCPVQSEALSAQLMKQKQRSTETVDEYAQEFDAL